MANIRGFELHEDLYYLVEKHVWASAPVAGVSRIGMTPVAYQLLAHSLVAISVKQSVIGKEVAKGKSVAMVESLKFIGPVPAPFTGVVLRGNPLLEGDPEIAERDPYGDGLDRGDDDRGLANGRRRPGHRGSRNGGLPEAAGIAEYRHEYVESTPATARVPPSCTGPSPPAAPRPPPYPPPPDSPPPAASRASPHPRRSLPARRARPRPDLRKTSTTSTCSGMSVTDA